MPVGATPLDVWCSAADVPACLKPHVPPDFDFSREMLAAALAAYLHDVEIKTAPKLIRAKQTVLIDEEEPFRPCPICRGAVDHLSRQALLRPPVVAWRLPKIASVEVFHHRRRNPQSPHCTPCTAP